MLIVAVEVVVVARVLTVSIVVAERFSLVVVAVVLVMEATGVK